MYMTLFMVVFVSAMRAATEDLAKHRNDAARNATLYEVISSDGNVTQVMVSSLLSPCRARN